MSTGFLARPISTRVMNLAHLLTQAAQRFPERTGLIWGQRSWTWRELDRRVQAVAAALHAHGVRKGDRILIQSRNNNAMFETMFVAFRLGAIWVPTNFRLTPEEVGYIAKASGAKVLIYDSVFTDHADRCRSCALNTIISIGRPRAGEIDYEGLAAGEHESFAAAAVDRDDPCWFFFTSGTTGHPKAAMLTHAQMAFVITNHLADLMPGMSEEDASIVVAPLSHGAGIHQLIQIARAVPTILPAGERLDPRDVFRLIERHRVTNMFTVPVIVKRLVEDPSISEFDLSSLKFVIYAGAPMYRTDQQEALRKLGKVLVQYFGLGEVTGNITVFPPHLHDPDDAVQGRIGTCGFARTGMQISIQDADGHELPQGETGEICVIGPAVFAGYFNNPDANAKSFRDGWFLTGDLGHVDAEGFLYITGRASDMYISGGSNIYPREIEEKLLMHPAIREAAVVGMPDEKWGEAGVAAVVLRPGASLDAEELRMWMTDRIARYKQPRDVVFFDELPKSNYGKITKKLVRAAIEERLAENCTAGTTI